MPYVLDGKHGRVDISALGKRHEIEFRVDQIRQEPAITHTPYPDDNVKTGTTIKIHWPVSACSKLGESKTRFLQLAADYTFLNPHLTLSLDWFGDRTTTNATNSIWRKWGPSEPTSPWWYGPGDFERLIAAYITHDQDRDNDRSVRELVAEFRGLTGTAKQKAVLEETGLARTNLSALVDGDGLQHEPIAQLLTAIQKHSKPVKPAALGIIGEAHIRSRFEEIGCEMKSFGYRKTAEVDSEGLPSIIETAFVWRGEDSGNPAG